jgi:ferredoxin
MRAKVDMYTCMGCGICVSIAPHIFRFEGESYAVAYVRNVPPEEEDAVRKAAQECPEEAVLVSE